MALLVFDFTCRKCGAEHPNVLIDTDKDPTPQCSKCHIDLSVNMPLTKQFSTIVPTYPGAKAKKAGYQHLHVNRPATKTQVGYGGGVTKGDDK